MSTYLRMGESPGGLDNTLLFGGMYGKELNFSPKGDYGASEDELYGQKGPLYIPDWDPSLSTDSLAETTYPTSYSGSSTGGDWHWKKTIAMVLFLFAVITILANSKFGIGKILMTNFPLQVMALVLGAALYFF